MSKITNRLAFFAKIKKRSDDLETYVAKASGKADAGAINVHEDHKPFVEREPYVANRYATDINYAVSQYPVKDTAITNFDVEARAKKVSQGHFTGASHYLVNEVMFENAGARGYTLMVTGWTGKGTISKTVGGVVNEGPYAPGTAVTVTVTPNAGYVFTKWSDDVTDNPRTIIMNSNVVLAAVIDTVPVYALNFSATGFGTVAATAAGTAVQSGVQLEAGVDVALTATPNEGYVVDQWSGLPEGAEVSGNTASFLMPAAAVTAGVNFVEAPTFQGLKLTNVETVTSITIGEGYTFPFFAVVQGDHYFQWGDSSNQICTDKRNPAVGDSAYDGGGTPYPITAVTTSSENTLDFTPDLATGFESMSYSLDDGATFNSWPTAPGVGGLRVEHEAAGQYAGDYVYGYEGSEGYWWYLVTNTEKYVTTTVRNPQVGDSVYCRGEYELAGGITSVTSGCVESVEVASTPGVTYWFTDVQPSGSAPYRWTSEDADPIFTAVRHPSNGTSVYSSSSSGTPSSTVTATAQETAFVSVTYTGSICLKGKSAVWAGFAGGNSFTSSICVNASGRLSSIISDTDTPQEIPEFGLGLVFGTSAPTSFPGILVVDASGLILDDTLSMGSYAFLFAYNVTLTTAPSLPITTLTNYCYAYMFQSCISLVTAPSVLPALVLPDSCYTMMFTGCTSLVTAPEILATSFVLAEEPTDENYYGCSLMFAGCTSLVTAPSHLYPEEVPFGSYDNMFYGCTSLVNAPTIHAVSAIHNEEGIGNGSFQAMFSGCTSLVNPPIFSSLTTVDNFCCEQMFRDCTSLISTPVLRASVLKESCYDYMFNNCVSLKTVVCLATDISASGCTSGWLDGVAASGTFVGDTSMDPEGTSETRWPRNESGVPDDWTYIGYVAGDATLNVTVTGGTVAATVDGQSVTLPYTGPKLTTVHLVVTPTTAGHTVVWSDGAVGNVHDVLLVADTTLTATCQDLQPLTFTVLTGSSGKLTLNRSNTDGNYEYSVDGGAWTAVYQKVETLPEFTTSLRVRGHSTGNDSPYFYDNMSGATTYKVSGRPSSLIDGLGAFVESMDGYSFVDLFGESGGDWLVDASGIILDSTTLGYDGNGNGCYAWMFENCHALTSAPALPATTLVSRYDEGIGDYKGCYDSMFTSCGSLAGPISIAAASPLVNGHTACSNMFQDAGTEEGAGGTIKVGGNVDQWNSENCGIDSEHWTVQLEPSEE